MTAAEGARRSRPQDYFNWIRSNVARGFKRLAQRHDGAVKRFKPESRRAIVVGLILLALYIAYGALADGGTARNERHAIFMRQGSETSLRSADTTPVGDALIVAPGTLSPSLASWDVSPYELSHVLGNAQACAVNLFVLKPDLMSATPSGAVDILFNGAVVRHIAFSAATSGFFPVAPGRFFPADLAPHAIEIVPLDRRFGFVIPLPGSACAAKQWTIGIRAQRVTWTISAVGFDVRYTPARAVTFVPVALAVIAGFALLGILIASLFLVLLRMSSLGLGPLITAAVLLAAAPLTYDQWDFPLWIRFSEIASFGGGEPARLWTASPLWAFVPSLFSTITLGSYLITGDGSRTLTEILLKIGTGVAFCINAYAIAMVAPRRLRRFIAMTALLLPGGLYSIAGGYRESFAIGLALAALALSHRGKLAFATVVFCAAASISETLLPIVLFPAALALAEAFPLRNRATRAILLAALGIALFGAEWLFLIPSDRANAALTYRFGRAPLGGASWAGALSGLHLLPDWLPVGSVAFGVAVFVAAAALPALRLVAIVRRGNRERRFTDVLGVFVALLAAFFLAFRGVDPNTWCTLMLLALYFFAKTDAGNPFPLLFGSILGLAYYAIAGFGDFASHAVLWPFDRSLLGILGVSRYVFDLMQNALALCLIVALSRANTRLLFSLRSPWFLMLFFAAVATSAIRFYALDFIICTVSGVLIVSTFARQIASQRRSLYRTPPLGRASGAGLIATVGAVCGERNLGAGLAASGALLITYQYGFGLCDIVLAVGAIGVLSVQPGVGWTSVVGWCILGALVVRALVPDRERDAELHIDHRR